MDEGSEAPKKIALKVPSLFIKGPSSQPSNEEKSETPEQKKPARPMPASMRRKLEEAKQKENSDNLSEISSVSSTPSESTRTSRPGPASAKRKLSATSTSEKVADDDDTKSNLSSSSNSQKETTQKSRPMPASARKKLEENGEGSKVDGDNNGFGKESSETTDKGLNSVKRPMPAFAKKRLEEKTGDETKTGPDTSSSSENIKEQKKVNRPMPASARKKLETATNEGTDEKMDDTGSNVSSRSESARKSEETSCKIRRPGPASAKRKFATGSDSVKKDNEGDDDKTDDQRGSQGDSKSERMEGESSETKEAKKINISLGGIKFPTFSKPMPASAKRKVETPANEDEKPSNSPSRRDNEPNDKKDDPARSSRRSRGSTNEFMALDDNKYPCDICGYEFYSLSKKLLHEKSHLEKGADDENERKPKSVPKSKKKVVDDKFKGMTNCPHCNKHFSVKKWKILKAHATKCARPAIFGCQFCDKKFKYVSEKEKHEKTHLKTKKDEDQSDFNNESVPSPMSHNSKNDDSKSSTKGSVTEKPRAMPRSVKAKIDKEKDVKEENGKTDNDSESKVLSSDTRSFKRKIAEVLSNLGTRYSKLQSSSEANDDAEIDSPPRKKTVLSKSKEDNSESIRGHPMPASVKKKLEDRGRPVPSSPTQEDEDDGRGDVDPLECAVCHRVFTQKANRMRHERTVHSIEHPSQNSEIASPTSDYEPVTPRAEKIYKEDIQTSKVEIGPLPHKSPGNCPICSKFIQTSLRRHIQNVHKIPVPSMGSTPVKSPAKPVAPKSYKIYKTATNKIKQKLALSSSTTVKKPVVSLPKAEVEKKSENKVIASTASSDLRCACCDKIFQVNCDFHEHMRMAHPRVKRLVTCKLCDHKFSHEEDFLLHIQFKHQELVAGMKQKPESPPAKKDSTTTKRHSEHVRDVSTPSSSRTTRKSNVQEGQPSSSGSRNSTTSKKVTVGISLQDKKLAEDALRRQASRKSETSKQHTRSTRRNSMISSTNEIEIYEETYHDDDDDHFDDSEPMEVEESEIAITSTFSQKVSPTKQEKFKAASSSDLDAMHCSTCSEVFYSYEALRKHELYFHNVKSSKMCPICGVYPSKLARHLLAHENKTVRCSCVPCHLSFQDFGQLLKHNLEKHPGDNGGALCAPNKPRDETQTGSQALTFNSTDTYRCTLCRKEFTGGSNARRHIGRSHPEQESEAETLMERVGGDAEKVDQEVEDILEDTNKKLMDPDWDDSDNDAQPETHIVSRPAQSSSIVRQSSRPMPASARAKLGQQKDDQVSTHSDAVSGSSKGNSKQGGRPMPASVRAKLEAQKKLVETPPSSNVSVEAKKPSRPMPASVRAKLATQTSTTSENSNSRDSSVNNSANKPRRPMPASVKAKLGIGKASETAVSSVSNNSVNNVKVKKARSPSPQEVVTIDDDDDDGPVDDAFPEPEPTPPSVPTFSIADEIAEHNRAVRMAMGEDSHPVESRGFSSFYMFQCKLCDKKFDSSEETRRHIRRAHSEYNEDHVENMIGQLFDEYANTSRRRKSNVRYNDDYMDDIDDEVIIPRGTARRPKSNPSLPPVHSSSKPKPSKTQDNDSDFKVEYACKWCGTRKDSPANVRRHISKAHPEMYGDQRENGVVTLEADQDFVLEEPPPPPERASNPIYVCKICSRCMTVRQSLYMHITRSHPEVGKGNATNYIQELNGNNDNSPAKNKPVEVESPDNSYYCSICSFQTSDEMRYVSHYKNHCGVSPYQCQYCSATFDRHQHLNDHLTREHTGAEFLTADETEISMEEVVGSNQISVGTTSKVQIETQKPFSLLRKSSSDSNGHSEVTPKRRPPGPASRKTAAAKKEMPIVNEIEMDTGSPPPPPEDDEMESSEQTTSPRETQNEPAVYSYQGDLSSLFPTLGGGAAPGGIDALDDIDGGMSLD